MPSEIAAFRAMLKDNPEMRDKLREWMERGILRSSAEIAPGEPITVLAGPDHGQITGSQQARCDCGVIVWLSPSTQEMIKARGAAPTQIMCNLCFFETVRKERETQRPQ